MNRQTRTNLLCLFFVIAASLPIRATDASWMAGFVQAGLTSGGGMNCSGNGLVSHGNEIICYGQFLYPSKSIASWNTTLKSWDDMRGGIWMMMPYSYTFGNTTSYYPGTTMRNAVVLGDSLFVFGDVRHVDGQRGVQPAIWNFKTRSWSFLHQESDSINLGLTTGCVLYHDSLIFSGYFYRNGKQMPSPIKWNGTTFVPLADSTVTSIHGTIREFKGQLYAMAVYSDTGNGLLARWTGSGWQPILDSVMLNGRKGGANLVECTATHMYLSGGFNQVAIHGDSMRSLRYLIRYDGTKWESLVDTADQGFSTVSVADSILVAGGQFTSVNNILCNSIAELNLNTGKWTSLGSGFGNSGSGGVRSVKILNNTVYVCGAFNVAGTVGASNIASFDRTTQRWQTLSGGKANALSSYNTHLYNFANQLEATTDAPVIGSTPVNHLVKFQDQQWKPVGSGLIGSFEAVPPPQLKNYITFTTGPIEAVAGETRYFGGAYTHFAGQEINGIFRLRNGIVESMDSGFHHSSFESAGFNVWMQAYPSVLIPIGKDSLIAGGDFTSAGAKQDTVNSIALFDGTKWRGLGKGLTTKNASGTYINGDVNDMIRDSSGNIYVCGDFRVLDGHLDCNGLAKWDGKTWTDLLSDASQSYAAKFKRLFMYHDTLLVFGNDPNVNSFKGLNTLYKVYDGKPHELATFVNDTSGIYAVALQGDSLVVGGSFAAIGGIQANGIACYNMKTNSWSAFGSGIHLSAADDSLKHADDEHVTLYPANVSQIVFVHDTMYITGSFLLAGSTPAHGIAAWAPSHQNSNVDNDTDCPQCLTIIPNPAQNEIEFLLPSHRAGVLHVSVRDILGMEVMTASMDDDLRAASSKLDIHQLANGCYILDVQQGAHRLSARFMVVR